MAVFTKKISGSELLVALENCEFYQDKGAYEVAFLQLKKFWLALDLEPDIEDLPDSLRAKTLLACGSLAGFLGNSRKIGQESAKNLLTNARELILSLDLSNLENREMLSKAENSLALCEWRNGYYDEAKIWLEESFSHDLPETSEVSILSHLLVGMIQISEKKYQEILRYYLTHRKLFENSKNNFTKGNFCLNISSAYRHFDDFETATNYLEEAKKYFQKINHHVYVGVTENNLAINFQSLKDYEKAHSHIDSAIKIFQNKNDIVRMAQSLDTKAQIFLDQKRYEECLKAIGISVEMLEETEYYAILAESLITKYSAEFLSEQIHLSLSTYTTVLDIARQHLPAAFNERVIGSYANLILKAHSAPLIIECETPMSEGIDFVLIDNDVAITRKENIKAGDYVILDYERSTYAGIISYDNLLNLIILELKDSAEPLVISKNEAGNIRKVIGTCSESADYSFKQISSNPSKRLQS